MNKIVKRTMRRTLSTVLVFALLLTSLPGLTVWAAPLTNTSVQTAIDNATGFNGYSLEINNDPDVMGTLDLTELKSDYPNLTYVNVSNTNITDIVGSGVPWVVSDGTFVSGAANGRELIPLNANLTYGLTSMSAGIDLDDLINDLQAVTGDATDPADLISGVAVTIDSTPITPIAPGTYGTIDHADLAALSLGSHALTLEFDFHYAIGWTYSVTYSLNITDQVLSLTPDTVNAYQGGTVVLELELVDENGNQQDVGDIGTNLTISNPFSGVTTTITDSKIGNKVQLTIDLDPTEPTGPQTLSVSDSITGKTASADITVLSLPTLSGLEFDEVNNGVPNGAFDETADTMYIRGGTSISSRDLINAQSIGGRYEDSTVYLLSDGGSPVGDEFCTVLSLTDVSGNVTGEFISVGGQAALRVSAVAVNAGTSGSFTISSSAGGLTPVTVDYIILESAPSAYVLYMVDGSVSSSANIQNLIDADDPALTVVAEYHFTAGWEPVNNDNTATMLEQKDAWFVMATQYADNGPLFVVPFNSMTSWQENLGNGNGIPFTNTSRAFTGTDIEGQLVPVGGGTTQSLWVTPQLGSGGETVSAFAQVNDGSGYNTLYFNIEVTPRSIDYYEFRTSTGGTLFPTDTLVPIGTSADFQIFAVYDNGQAEQVDFAVTELDVTYSDTTLFPAGPSNPSRLTGGNLATFSATDDGQANDFIQGQTSTITVTDDEGNTGSVTLTMDYSQIVGVTYYVETPSGIMEYGGTDAIQKTFSEAELVTALQIPRGLNARLWIVPVFTNTTMYDADTKTGDWELYGVTTSGYSISSVSANRTVSFGAPLTDGGTAFLLETDDNLPVDINESISVTVSLNSSVVSNGNSHDLAGSGVSANLTVAVTEPVVTAMDVEVWDGTNYTSIHNGTEYALSGSVGDEHILRVRVQYSDGNSVDLMGNNSVGTYASGAYFLPMNDVTDYDPSVGYTTWPSALTFGAGDDTELGVSHGYFMSHSPYQIINSGSYHNLVNPTTGVPPSQSDWNHGRSEAAVQTILATLSDRIEMHQVSGTAGGISTDYLYINNGVVPGHYSVTMRQEGSYILDFSGLYSGNGFVDEAYIIDGITGSPLEIEVTVAPPTIERVYLVSDDVDIVTPAASTPGTDLYEFDKTNGSTFIVYPMILDSSYYLTTDYASSGNLPDYLNSTGSAATLGISKVSAADWNGGTIGTWTSSNTASLNITPKVDTAGDIYLEVNVLGFSDIPQSSPVSIDLALSMALASGVTRYDLTTPPADPNGMAVYTVTDPIVQDIRIDGGYGYTVSGTVSTGFTMEAGNEIYFPVKYYVSDLINPRNLNVSEYPGASGTTNVLVVTPDPANPGTCALRVDLGGDLIFTPSATGQYTFELSTVNSGNVTIPTSTQGPRTISFTVIPQTLNESVYYGESISVSGLPANAVTLVEAGGAGKLDTAALAAGQLKMISNTDDTTVVEAKDASGVVVATVNVRLIACNTITTLVPTALTSGYTFANGETMTVQWQTAYVKPGNVVTCVEYDDLTTINPLGPDDFLTLSGSTVTANAGGVTTVRYAIYDTATSDGLTTETILAILDPNLPVPAYTYELHDDNITQNVISSLALVTGQNQNVYVYDTTNSVYVSGFFVSSDAAAVAGVTNAGSYARVEGLSSGGATITFTPFMGGSVTLPVTVTSPSVWTVSGQVVDGSTSLGVDGATVTLTDNTNTVIDTTTTAGGGNYSFTSIPDGNYTATVTVAIGYVLQPGVSVNVGGGNATAPVITLTPVPAGSGHTVSGQVTDGTNDVNGAFVTLKNTTTNVESGPVTTAGNGDYSFTNVEDGNYDVTVVQASGYFVPVTVNVNVSGGNATAPLITLIASGTTASMAITPASIQTGETASAAVIDSGFGGTKTYTWSSSDTAIATVSSSTTNSAIITGVAAGSATITCVVADGSSIETATATITVTSGTTTPPRSSGGGGGGTSYTLTFETNGGSEVKTITRAAGTVVTLNQTTTREGYEFTGWYSDRALTELVTSITLNANTTVYAGWDGDELAGQGDDHFAYMSGKDGGLFEPDAPMTRAEVAMVFARLMQTDGNFTGSYSNSFTDVASGSWYHSAVGYVQEQGLISGYPDGTFLPDNNITRAEFAVIISNFTEASARGSVSFNDVTDSHWAYDYIRVLAGNGWANGYPDGSFQPGNNITRAEVVTIVNNALNRSADEAYISSNLSSLNTFSDVPASHWAYYNILEAANSHDYVKSGSTETWID